MLIALSNVGIIEKTVKLCLVKNMILFEKFPEVMLNQMGDKIKLAVQAAASLACDSHPVVGKAEFCVLVMKFGKNRVVKDALDYLDKKVSKMIDFD